MSNPRFLKPWFWRLVTLLGCLLPLSGMAAPERIVSLNLCSDALALTLAPERVVSVTFLAQDPGLSPVAELAANYPSNRGGAEEVLLLAPDLVLAGQYTTRSTVALLEKLGIPVLTLTMPDSLAEVREQIRQVAGVLGEAARGEARVAELDASLTRLERVPTAERPVTVVYQPNSAVVGEGTLINELMQRAGMRNLAAELGIGRWGTLPLEQLILADPDLLIIDQSPTAPAALANRVLRHPVLDHLSARRVSIPGQLWTCPGPWLAEALERLASARRDWQHREFGVVGR